ncbi:hypothetical protein N7495_004005 [Penicillium taxi]|uniref:uncharacterized protein n=1 Tax=Penicillium taxi TaxID=168475 RepID=UPI00254549EC|nr:uncharacterized protein N7495_004005 [Penicillium taxi]KAJ5899261.1 hypothetical protein N7495_004005 [Penicillium taxi]
MVAHQSRNSLSFWIDEGRHLTTLASRASMSLSKKAPTMPLKISAPSDFRHVQSFNDPQPPVQMFQPPELSPVQLFHDPQPLVPMYQPLELSIHQSGGQLSDLPSFDSFQFGEELRTPRVPSPVLSPTRTQSRRCVSMAAGFSVYRKPVGSEKFRSLSNVENVFESPHKPRITSVYIPHFSIINLNDAVPLEDPVPYPILSSSETSKLSLGAQRPNYTNNPPVRASEETLPRTPESNMNDELDPTNNSFFTGSPSSSVSSRTLPQISSLRHPPLAPSENRNTIASMPLANSLAQWSFPGQIVPPKAVSLAGENDFFWERTRTLSGTTVASNLTTRTNDANDQKPIVFTDQSLDDYKQFSIHEEQSLNLPLVTYAEDRHSTVNVVF